MTHFLQPSRRALMQGAAVLATAGAAPTTWAAVVIAPAAAQPVVTFYRDELIVDVTGKSPPYRPPAGLRSAASVEHLSDIEIRWLHGWA
jgi:hypothetical protein